MCILLLYSTHFQAFDQHLNLVLGEVEECITTKEVDEETEEEIIKVRMASAELAVIHLHRFALQPLSSCDVNFFAFSYFAFCPFCRCRKET